MLEPGPGWATLWSLLFTGAVYALASSQPGLGDAPLFLFAVPLALCAMGFGVRGGLAYGVFGSVVATTWWIDHGHPGGLPWLSTRAAALLCIGLLLGWFSDSRQALLRELASHAELSLDLIARASFDGYFLRVNPAFTRVLGWQPEQLLSRPFLDFVHPDDREATLAAVREQTEAGHEVLSFQNRYRARDGSYRWLEWTSRPDPKAKALIAVARDIGERKELEERERAYQQRLERAVGLRTRELELRTRELEEARRETLRRLALAAEYRDDETHRHTERVGRTAALVAGELGLDDDQVNVLREAALLHDVGKVGVSDELLLKRGRLSPEEFEQVKTHALTGARILADSSSEILCVAEEIALAHHEWWDGSGYPHGLHGEEIPLSARIVALADVYDALTHARPYKDAWPVNEAVAEIHRLSGRQFDPAVVDAFARLDPYLLADVPPAAGADTERAPQPRPPSLTPR